MLYKYTYGLTRLLNYSSTRACVQFRFEVFSFMLGPLHLHSALRILLAVHFL